MHWALRPLCCWTHRVYRQSFAGINFGQATCRLFMPIDGKPKSFISIFYVTIETIMMWFATHAKVNEGEQSMVSNRRFFYAKGTKMINRTSSSFEMFNEFLRFEFVSWIAKLVLLYRHKLWTFSNKKKLFSGSDSSFSTDVSPSSFRLLFRLF